MRRLTLFALLLALPYTPALARLVPEGPEFVVASACPAYGLPRAAMNGTGEFIVAGHSEELAPPGTPIPSIEGSQRNNQRHHGLHGFNMDLKNICSVKSVQSVAFFRSSLDPAESSV